MQRFSKKKKKNRVHNTYLIEPGTVEVLRSKHALLDTNFLIDASIFEEEAAELVSQLQGLNCDLLTTRSVILEALGGTKDEARLNDKIAYLELVFGRPFANMVGLPLERDLPSKTDLLAFSRQCNKFSATDFELFLTLKKYKSSGILLITRNHSDFTSKVCNRAGYVTLFGDKEIRTYGVYQAR